MALNDTITELLRRQAAQRTDRAAEPDVKVEWSTDVDAVMDTIRATLVPYTETGNATVSSELISVSEELIGSYPAQRLNIEIAGIGIIVEPVARFIFGGTGRIDMYRDNRTSESDRFLLLRPKDEEEGKRAPWLIESKSLISPFGHGDTLIMRGSRRYLTLDKDSIESAIEYLLTMG